MTNTATVSIEESKRRHDELTQLEVSRTLRIHQRAWFDNLRREVLEDGKPFIITAANFPHEILEALDIASMTDVWYSGLIAAKRESGYYSQLLQDAGYHLGLSRYAALPLAVALDTSGREKPWAGFPKPHLVTSLPYSASSELLAKHFGVPHISMSRPPLPNPQPNWWEIRWNWEDVEGSERIDVVVAQFDAIVEHLEHLAGKRLDLDRLREIVDKSNRQAEYFTEVRDLLCSAPKLPVRLGEVMSQVMGIQWHRGTDWAVDQAKAFADEVRARVANEQWVCPNERFRLMYIGAGLWQQLEFFTEFEESHGAVFARSNYLSIACDGYPRYGRDPVRALAARYVTMNDRLHLPPWAGAWNVWEAGTHRLSGGIQIESLGAGQKFITHSLEQAGYPILQFPVDPLDTRTWDPQKTRELVTDFIENRLA
jgi:benzoyl-CoA reductase subunit B